MPPSETPVPVTSDGVADLLFARVPAEDLAPYDDAGIAALAEAARGHLTATRLPGTTSLRVRPVRLEVNGSPRERTVVEAVNDDVPFLLDSTLAELGARALEPQLVAHPVLSVRRAPDGAFVDLADDEAGDGTRESLIHIHLDRALDEPERVSLSAALHAAYADLRAVARDADAMRGQLDALAAEYGTNPPPIDPAEAEDATAFLHWLDGHRFKLFGLRAYRFREAGAPLEPLSDSGLGLLADPHVEVLRQGADLVGTTPELQAFMTRPDALLVAKASVKSRVWRRAYLDFIAVKLFSPSGRLWGQLTLVGLFSPSAYTAEAAATPYLRRKIAIVRERAGLDADSFDGRTLTDALESFPRDELFQIDPDTLHAYALVLLRLSEHPRIRVLARVDPFERFVSVVVYVPKDRYDATVRRRVGEFLAVSYEGRVSATYPAYPDGPLARTHYIIGRDGGPAPAVARDVLERGVATIARTWADALGDALAAAHEGGRGAALAARYANAFGPDYRAAFEPATALDDIGQIERLGDVRPRAVDLYRRAGDGPARVNLKLFSRGAVLPLSQRVPILEQLGFRVADERTYEVALPPDGGAPTTWIHDIALERASGAPLDLDAVAGRVEAALLAVFRGVAEADGFNKLVLEAGLGWREAALFRAFGRYLRQLGTPYAQGYLADVLARHGTLAAALGALFLARFDPRLDDAARAEREGAERARIDAQLAQVTSLDDDRILRRFLNLVDATLRTTFFRIGPNGLPDEVIGLKFDAHAVDGMPAPRPRFEILVNSPQVEGVHLRFGHVARGGLRWSDRPQDFRTEVLGLVKAQQVKNAVIVPVGAKGGFFPKQLPPASDRAAWMAAGTEAYRTFVRTLLDLTDNIVDDVVVPPPATVRRDGDDAYLVVAADKGTATFSDIANAISLEKGHWLGDAFASGGSNGYDHKAMGITARGAWEAVKRHFREMDADIERDPATVAGVGDMSGDVFGNGMLLSRTMKLVAAFDHRDIFLDPDPEPDLAFAERERLFRLPRSSWADYDRDLISAGGGVFSRSSKSIALSAEARALLGLDVAAAGPSEIMAAILKAPVDLLWFGGIGTYVRAAAETDAAVGDRANDAIRVTGAELRAKVVGEGANLGLTQLGRIEAARAGIRLNTDAIDNSAGVNTSDVEVNIKIALAAPVRDGRLDEAARSALLAEMTQEVARLVLRNNELQTLALSLAERHALDDLGFHARLMQVLEEAGRLDRAVEFLPRRTALEERRRDGHGLTRPELAVLLAYAKLALHDELLASAVPDDPYLGRELDRYFPAPLRERFPDAIASHRLRREIIATQLANAIVNRGGPAVVVRLADETGADAATIAFAYAATRDSFALSDLYAAIDALNGEVPGAVQLGLYEAVQQLALSRITWFIRNVALRERGLDDVVATYRDGVAAVAATLPGSLPEAVRAERGAETDRLARSGVPRDLAERIALLPALATAPDIVWVASRQGVPVEAVAAVHLALGDALGLVGFFSAAGHVPVPDHYDRLARDRAMDAVTVAHRRLTAGIAAGGDLGPGAVPAWTASRAGELGRTRAAVDSIIAADPTVSKLTVAASLVADLAKD